MNDFKLEIEVIKFDNEDVIACSGGAMADWAISESFKYDPRKDDILADAERWLKDHGYQHARK